MEFARRNKHASELDMTPLIDIVFLLVIFFMLTTGFVASESIELNLPGSNSAQAQPVAAPLPPVRIRLEADGSFLLDETPVAFDALETQMLTTLGQAPDTPIGIFTTPGVSVQEMVRVMDMVYLSGGRKVKVERIEFAPQPIPSDEAADAV